MTRVGSGDPMTPLRSTLLIAALFAMLLLVVPAVAELNYTQTDNGKTLIPDASYWITIDPVGNKTIGETISVAARTNIPVGEEILIEVSTSPLTSCPKDGCSYLHRESKVIVTKGDNQTNKTFLVFDTSLLRPNEYVMSERATGKNTSATILFNIVTPPNETAASASPLSKSPLSVIGTCIALTCAGMAALILRRRDIR